jgi:hypothetical protein
MYVFLSTSPPPSAHHTIKHNKIGSFPDILLSHPTTFFFLHSCPFHNTDEASAHCTAVATNMTAAKKADNKHDSKDSSTETETVPLHGRTMDWELDILRDLTIEVDFRRDNSTVFLATTWVGYIGVLTGMRMNTFSVSVNYRVIGDGFWTNIKKAISSAWPVGFLVREVLDTDSDAATDCNTFGKAVQALSSSRLVSPCYFTVVGARPNQGAIITRSRSASENPVQMAESKNIANTIVQTNMDHWVDDEDENIFYSRERRRRVAHRFAAGAAANSDATGADQNQILTNEKDMWSVLKMKPLSNEITLYATVMCPGTGFYETRLVDRGRYVRS